MQAVTPSFIASAALLVAAWLISNHYPPWLAAHGELLAALSVAALGLSAARRTSSPAALRVGYPVVFFLALASIPVLQLAAGEVNFAGDAWIAFLYLACAACAIAWSAQACSVSAEPWTAVLAWAFVAGAIASSAIAFAQQWQSELGVLSLYVVAMPAGDRPFANLAQPNLLATLLALGLAGTLFLFETRRLSATTSLVVAAPLIVAQVLTLSRTVLLLFVFAIGWHIVMRRRVPLRIPLALLLSLAAAWGAMFLAWPRVAESIGLSAAASTAARLEPGTRSIIWRQLVDAAMRRPWSGFGWNQVSDAQVSVAADYPQTEYVANAHNILLNMVLWNGFPLALVFVGAAVIWLVRSAIRVRSISAAFGLLVILLLLAHAMVEYPLDYLFFLVPFAFAIGILSHETRDPARGMRIPAITNAAVLLFFAAVTIAATVDYWHVEEAFRDMRFAVAQIGRSMPGAAPPDIQTEFTQLAALRRFTLSMPGTGMRTEDLQSMREVSHRYAYAPNLYKYALAQALNGDIPGARLTLLQMRQLHGQVPYVQAREELRTFAATRYPELRALDLP
jgi:O-antigen ligase